mmetsp:Transcript_25317/g.51906  ORF Transcript_25317/g.51906 Transcript_25317/m.51906 type:complete len:93 (+) Transcript_25317:1-279(+)
MAHSPALIATPPGARTIENEAAGVYEKFELQLLDVLVEHQPLVASAACEMLCPPVHNPLGSYLVVTPAMAVAVYELVTPDVPVLPPVSSVYR